MKVLNVCIKLGVNMTTSSYISPEMEKLHDEAVRKNMIVLNEIGLDPGIDIMSTIHARRSLTMFLSERQKSSSSAVPVRCQRPSG